MPDARQKPSWLHVHRWATHCLSHDCGIRVCTRCGKQAVGWQG